MPLRRFGASLSIHLQIRMQFGFGDKSRIEAHRGEQLSVHSAAVSEMSIVSGVTQRKSAAP